MTCLSRKASNSPSYTVHPIALEAAFLEMRNVDPAKNPTNPRSCQIEIMAARMVGLDLGKTCIRVWGKRGD